jgi:hypothetical protein
MKKDYSDDNRISLDEIEAAVYEICQRYSHHDVNPNTPKAIRQLLIMAYDLGVDHGASNPYC